MYLKHKCLSPGHLQYVCTVFLQSLYEFTESGIFLRHPTPGQDLDVRAEAQDLYIKELL